MTRRRSIKEAANGESVGDDDFRRCIAAAVEESLGKDTTLDEMLATMRRKMKGVRH
jgi:hypothetical protein